MTLAESLEVRAPDTLAALQERAHAHWATRKNYAVRPVLDGEDHVFIDRICRNYLRHQCSDYDRLIEKLVDEFRGVPGAREIYGDVVRPHIDALVNKALNSLRSSADAANGNDA